MAQKSIRNLVSSLALPLATASALLAGDVKAGQDEIEILSYSPNDSEIEGGSSRLVHNNNRFSGEWSDFPISFSKGFKPFFLSESNTHLSQIVKDELNQNIIQANLSSEGDFNLNDTHSNNLYFEFYNKDINRVYLTSVNISQNNTVNNQPYSYITNLTHVNSMFLLLPNLTKLSNETIYGSVQVSSKFKQDTTSTLEDTLLVYDPTVNQVSGVDYQVSGVTNGVAVVNGSDIHFTPSANHFGTNTAGFAYVVKSGNNVLGEFNVGVNVSSVNDNPVVSNPIFNQSLTYRNNLNLPIPANTITDVEGPINYTVNTNGLPPGIVFNGSNLSGIPTLAGNYNIELVGTDSSGAKATNNFTINVNKKSLTVKALNQSRNYGDSNAPYSYSLEGIISPDNASVVSGSPGFSTSANATSPVGNYAININLGNLSAQNYSFDNFVDGQIQVTPAPLNVNIDDKNIIYGDFNPELTGSITGIKNSENINLSLSTPLVQGSNIGTYPINLGISGDLSNYNVVTNLGNIIVGKRNLTINVDGKSKVYGSSNPELTGSSIGSYNNELQFGFSTSANATSPVGTYPITPIITDSQNKLSNYNVVTNGNDLNVTKAVLLAKADNKSKVYGSSVPTLTYNLSGFVNEDNSNVVSGNPIINTSAGAFSQVGQTPINISQGTLSAQNYSFTTENGILTTTPASLTVKAVNQSREYGLPNGAYQFDLEGLLGSDNASVVTGSPGFSTSANQLSGIGVYPLNVNLGNLSAQNYSFDNFVDGQIQVTKAPLIINVDGKSKVYGSSNPELTGSVNGIRNSDSIITTLSTSANATSPVGTYSITPSISGELSNYNVTTNLASLLINPANLSVQANNKKIVVNNPIPNLNGSSTGLAPWDNGNINVNYSVPAGANNQEGEHTITAQVSGSALSNYNLLTIPGTLSVVGTNRPPQLSICVNEGLIDIPVQVYTKGRDQGVITVLDYSPNLDFSSGSSITNLVYPNLTNDWSNIKFNDLPLEGTRFYRVKVNDKHNFDE